MTRRAPTRRLRIRAPSLRLLFTRPGLALALSWPCRGLAVALPCSYSTEAWESHCGGGATLEQGGKLYASFQTSGKIFRVGVFLDFVRRATRAECPHGVASHVRGANRNEIELTATLGSLNPRILCQVPGRAGLPCMVRHHDVTTASSCHHSSCHHVIMKPVSICCCRVYCMVYGHCPCPLCYVRRVMSFVLCVICYVLCVMCYVLCVTSCPCPCPSCDVCASSRV